MLNIEQGTSNFEGINPRMNAESQGFQVRTIFVSLLPSNG
jgi:hypothetical protein